MFLTWCSVQPFTGRRFRTFQIRYCLGDQHPCWATPSATTGRC